MRAYLINPFAREVLRVNYDGDFNQIYEFLGGVRCFTCVTINQEGDSVYVDDEGLFNGDNEFFSVAGYPEPLAGFGLVLGCDREGESVAPSLTLETLRDRVKFWDRWEIISGKWKYEVYHEDRQRLKSIA